MSRELDVAVDVAREAGAMIRERFGTDVAIDRKGRIDLVTEVDHASEKLIVERLRRETPEHAVLSEEGHGTGPAEPGQGRWIVDPLDGTTNFAHAYPCFSVSIALQVGDELRVGVVLDPVRDELFTAERGAGAELNGEPIAVSGAADVESGLLVTGFPYDVRERPEPQLSLFRAFLTRAQGVRRDGSAALDFCYLACGRFDAFWELGLKAWDAAAGVLIVEEAGGRVTRFDGSPFDPFVSEMLATNGHLHAEMQSIIAAVLADRGAA